MNDPAIVMLRHAVRLCRREAVTYFWLSRAVAAVEDGTPLDEAFHLTRAERLRDRNRLLAKAAEQALPGSAAWQKAGELQRRITWARTTSDESEVARLIRLAAACAELPKTKRQIYSILTAEKERAKFQYSREKHVNHMR